MHWGVNTDEGVKENEGNMHFEELVKQRCPYCFDLLTVFQERAGMKPKMTSDNLGDDSTEDFDVFDENANNSSGKYFEDVNITDNSGKTMAVSKNSLSGTPQNKSNNNH